MRRVLLAWAVVVAAIGLASAPARADAPRDHGWWTLTNPGGPPTTPPAPPDVPAGGLLDPLVRLRRADQGELHAPGEEPTEDLAARSHLDLHSDARVRAPESSP